MENKVWTAEDPIEITHPGLLQIQMNPRAGITFATAMRAFLRADPESVVRLFDMGVDPFNFADALIGVPSQCLRVGQARLGYKL